MDLSAEEYAASAAKGSPTYDHFFEKLLKLKDMMKTQAGRAAAEVRHQVCPRRWSIVQTRRFQKNVALNINLYQYITAFDSVRIFSLKYVMCLLVGHGVFFKADAHGNCRRSVSV